MQKLNWLEVQKTILSCADNNELNWQTITLVTEFSRLENRSRTNLVGEVNSSQVKFYHIHQGLGIST